MQHNRELVQLARLALAGRDDDVQMYIRRIARKLKSVDAESAEQLFQLLSESPTRHSPLRSDMTTIPVDPDSRLQLLRCYNPVVLDVEPIWAPATEERLRHLVEERKGRLALERAGLTPTKSALFVGPPGVGKTLAARWVARELNWPLLVLDLSAVMSSFLGRTGNNLRYVLDYAKQSQCVLLLDEFDAVAKRRDDAAEVGELKRLVTVLLQELDSWPSTNLLLAATNHPTLLDPATWRRFEVMIEFPTPQESLIVKALEAFLGDDLDRTQLKAVAGALRGASYNDIERYVTRARRDAVMLKGDASVRLVELLSERIQTMDRKERKALAIAMAKGGMSARRVHEVTGVSRDTIRAAVVHP